MAPPNENEEAEGRDENLLGLVDGILADKIALDEHQYRLVVLASLRDLRRELRGPNGIVRRVENLEVAVQEWRSFRKWLSAISVPLLLALILGSLGFVWLLIVHKFSFP